MSLKILNNIYRLSVRAFKSFDQLTGYRIGNAARKLTNVNTPNYWDRYLNSRGDFWRDFPYRFLLEALPKNEKFSLLDIGCALGDGCRLLKKSFPAAEITGADLSQVGIEKARAKSTDIEYFVFDLMKQDIPKKYDYITLIHILEHFDDPYPIIDKCLKAVNRAVYISTPYGGDFTNPRLYWKGEHRYLFNEQTFANYQFQVLKITERIEAVGTKHILYKIVPGK
jgi:2-polyprenyl-3-methyl-5-hydroxy-6-metoxy-1,4-benzoquinol methylase